MGSLTLVWQLVSEKENWIESRPEERWAPWGYFWPRHYMSSDPTTNSSYGISFFSPLLWPTKYFQDQILISNQTVQHLFHYTLFLASVDLIKNWCVCVPCFSYIIQNFKDFMHNKKKKEKNPFPLAIYQFPLFSYILDTITTTVTAYHLFVRGPNVRL